MLSNSWNKTEGESISQKVMGKVKPDAPLKNRIDFAQKKLQVQITKLSSINEKLQAKHDKIFEKCVNAQRNNKPVYAQAYAGELAQVRKMKNMVSGAKLSMEQVKLRLDTVSELGDVVVTLSPCMSIIKGLSPSLSGIMPEANASMQDLSSILVLIMYVMLDCKELFLIERMKSFSLELTYPFSFYVQSPYHTKALQHHHQQIQLCLDFLVVVSSISILHFSSLH